MRKPIAGVTDCHLETSIVTGVSTERSSRPRRFGPLVSLCLRASFRFTIRSGYPVLKDSAIIQSQWGTTV